MPNMAVTQTETEHPIICNTFSVNGILDNRKFQTRRIVTPQPPENADRVEIEENGTLGYFSGKTAAFHDSKTCPYGTPGDILWVRETFRLPKHVDGEYTPKEYVSSSSKFVYPHVRYEADGEWDNGLAAQSEEPEWGRKRPSIHMPRELCRLRLRVEDVSVERLQEISPEDVHAEGIRLNDSFLEGMPRHVAWEVHPEQAEEQILDQFAELWEEIHGKGAWERNDWVRCVEYSLITD